MQSGGPAKSNERLRQIERERERESRDFMHSGKLGEYDGDTLF